MAHRQLSTMAFRSKAADQSRAAAVRDLVGEAAREANAGRHAIAADLYRRCIERHPKSAEAWSGLGHALKHQGDVPGAVYAFQTAIGLGRDAVAVYPILADLLRRQGHLAEALATCESGLELSQAIGEGHVVRAAIHKDMGRREAAIDDLRLVLAAHPAVQAVRTMLIDTLYDADRLEEAAAAAREAIARNPDDATLRERLSRILTRQKRPAEALGAWEAIVALRPDDAEARRSLAVLYQEAGRTRDAFDTYQKALEIDPKFARAYTNLATLIMREFRLDLATSIFRVVIGLTPEIGTAYHNLGVVLRLQGQLEEAAENFRKALALMPDYFESLVELCHIRQHFCDWEGLDRQLEALFAASYRKNKPIPPFAVITSSLSSRAEQLACARTWGRFLKTRADGPLALYAPRPAAERRPKLRIGYASTDLHTHATAMLLVELLETHDRSRFELFAYSFGPDDGSVLRRRLVAAFDVFADFRGLSNAEATRRIHADDLDILIDLKGYTQDARTEIFAARPAPIQVNYLGYPGTMGADFIDYLVGDAIVTPHEHADSYDEKLVILPNCYQPNDRKRPVAPTTPTRASCGLPDDGFVFCCFNNSYKITGDVFAVWMRLLDATPGSVLWLLEPNSVVARNLRRAADTGGIASERIVFARRLPVSEHLARMRTADLFLDTLPVNAHTTASEALWVGLPVLTCLGDTFISRVAASLLHAVGLPDLVTTSLADYEALALRLAHDPDAVRAMRQTLEDGRLRTPLFDTDRYTHNFETALVRMVDLRDAGRPPEAFAVIEEH